VEVFADEWLPQSSLHHRWNLADNRRFALREFGRLGLPGLPTSVSSYLADRLAGQRMRSYLPLVGVDEHTIEGIERATRDLLAGLDAHFENHLFLLGDRPCLGDFALFGQLWAHHYRDVATTHLFDAHERLRRWLLAMDDPCSDVGAFLEGDRVPETLDPLLKMILDEALPFFVEVEAVVAEYRAENPHGRKPPRRLGEAAFTVGGVSGTRSVLSYAQWKLQRPLGDYQGLSGRDRERVDRRFESVGDPTLLRTEVRHPMRKERFRHVFAEPTLRAC